MTYFEIKLIYVTVENRGQQNEKSSYVTTVIAEIGLEIPAPKVGTVIDISLDESRPIMTAVNSVTMNLPSGDYQVELSNKKEYSESNFNKLVNSFEKSGWTINP